ncbi:hypothetical protein BD779DRAFT_957150 [Infundibulicybe gibba]|nr:hypothetical protein BD779DRAFT_957150 [Infundibulicybe gibba]
MVDPSIIRGTSLDTLDISVTVGALCESEPGTPPSEEITQKHSVNVTSAPEGWSSLGEYTWLGDLKTPLMCSIHVMFSSSLGLSLPSTPPLVALQILSDSLLGLDRTDTKFYLFSKRNDAGRKTQPLPIFASSQVLRGKSSYLDSLLTISGFKESALVDLDSTQPDLANFSDAGYDYDSDSDLDSDDGDEKPSTLGSNDPGGSPGAPHLRTVSGTKVSRRIGRIVYIPDAAYKTWKALIWYLYTGKIDFLPLRSQGQDPPPTTIDIFRPTCSPKSMYRLADKLEIPELRSLSLAALRSGITQSNVMQELFCRFTSLYPEVQEAESDFLIANFMSIPSGEFVRVQHLLSEGSIHTLLLFCGRSSRKA